MFPRAVLVPEPPRGLHRRRAGPVHRSDRLLEPVHSGRRYGTDLRALPTGIGVGPIGGAAGGDAPWGVRERIAGGALLRVGCRGRPAPFRGGPVSYTPL